MPPTNMEYVQPPVMTQRHIDAMHTVLGWWPFPTMFDRALLVEIHQHLRALLTQPVPCRELTPLERITHASNYLQPGDPSFESWLKGFDHLNDKDDELECTDQGEDPGPVDVTLDPEPMPDKVIEVLQTWRPTATGVSYSAVTPHREPSFENWLREYDHLSDEDIQSDQ